MVVKNLWTEKAAAQKTEIEVLRARVQYKDNLIDAMKATLEAREKLISETVDGLIQEKKANQNWCEFAHRAYIELKEWRELAQVEEVYRLNFVITQKDTIIQNLIDQKEGRA